MTTPTPAAKPAKIVFTKLQEARAMVARDSPYLQSLLWTVQYKRVTPEYLGRCAGGQPMATFAITSSGILLYTDEALAAWTARQVAGVIEHELWHLLSDHASRTNGRDPGLANVAKDIAINGMLLAGGRELPKTDCTPDFWGFRPGLTWEEYYDLLLKHPKMQEAQDKGKGEGQDPFGQCGSGAGNPLPNEPEDKNAPSKDGGGDASGDEPEGRTQDDLAAARRGCAAALAEEKAKEGGRGIGHVPDGMLRAVERLLAPAKVPWHAKLSRRLRKGTSTGPGMVDYVRDRMTRRMGALVIAGRRSPVYARLVAPLPRVLVAIDTSGSMGEDALMEAMAEVDGIFRAAQGRVAYCSCDAVLQSSGRGANWRDVARNLKGGGGTRISPMFEHAAGLRGEERPNLMVVFTDGGFWDCPEGPPPGIEVVWVLVGSHIEQGTIKFGDVIVVEQDEEE